MTASVTEPGTTTARPVFGDPMWMLHVDYTPEPRTIEEAQDQILQALHECQVANDRFRTSPSELNIRMCKVLNRRLWNLIESVVGDRWDIINFDAEHDPDSDERSDGSLPSVTDMALHVGNLSPDEIDRYLDGYWWPVFAPDPWPDPPYGASLLTHEPTLAEEWFACT